MRSDQQIIDLWLYGKAKLTQDSYKTDIEQFLSFVCKPLNEIALEDIQGFAKSLESCGLKASSQSRKLNAVKSLFTFAVRQQHVPMNVAADIEPPKANTNYAGRILKRDEMLNIINSAGTERNRLFLLLAYAIALRVSEACHLKWSDFTVRSDGKVQVQICGKGGKLASVIVPISVWEQIQVLRGDSDRLFNFGRRQAHNIIKKAVKTAGLSDKISMHWARHSLARHSLEAGAPIHLVRDTLRHSSIQSTDRYLAAFPDQSANDYLKF